MRHHSSSRVPRRHLLIAGAVGLCCALLALIRISLPTLVLFPRFSQFSPFGRATLLIQLLSPLFIFLLASGWTWFFLWIVGQRSSRPGATLIESMPPSTQTGSLPTSSGSSQEGATPMWSQGNGMKEKPIAVPPLFQLDPAQPLPLHMLPMTPIPATNSAWTPEQHTAEEETQGKEGSVNEQPPEAQAEPSPTSAVDEVASETQDAAEKVTITSEEQHDEVKGALTSEQRHDEERVATIPANKPEQFSLHTPSLHTPGKASETDTPVTISLLKQVRVWIRAQDGATMEVKLRGGENGIRLLVFAYIAWRQGEPADRDKMLTYVIARGKRRDMNTDQLAEVFDAAKKYLRQDLDRAVNALRRADHPFEMDVDFFSNEPGFYWLHPSCRVTDLGAIENYYNTILIARKEGLLDEKLDGSLPHWVIEACQKLIQAYTGDFLQAQIEKFPDECGGWIREPFTLYRDRYLDALLILANYESALGRNFLDEKLSPEQNEEQRRHHSARAAQMFYDYAMYAINSAWDRKLKFAYRAGKDGERVVMAARAIRRCVVELGKLGKPDMVDQAYLAFKERMSTLSEGNWKPDKDTESDVANAKKTTSAYRFSFQTGAIQQDQPPSQGK